MEPNGNQPNQPGGNAQPGPQPGGMPPAPDWPPRPHEVPDWQRGLGGQPAGGASVPQNPQPQAGPLPPAAGQPPAPLPPPTTPPAPAPAPPPASAGEPGPLKKRLRFIVIALIAMALLLGGLYFIIAADSENNPGANSAAERSSSEADENAINLSALQNISFGLPTDLSAFKGDSSTDEAYHIYLTQGSTDTKACSLEFGILPAEQLPGDDLESVVSPQVDSLKQAGATVEGPKAGKALILKDSGDEPVTYGLPTLDYTFSKDNKTVAVHYSLAILKDGTRAVVSRQCANTGAPADAAELAKVEAAARQITIHKQ